MKTLIKLFLSTLILLSIGSVAHATNYCTNGKLGAGWKLDEVSGSALDCSGNSNSGTLNGVVTQGITGEFSTAYSFNNSNSTYLQVSAATSINGLTNVSFGAWIKPNSAGRSGNLCTGAGVINKTDGSHGPEFCINSDGSFEFQAWWTGGGVKWKTNTTPIVTGVWQHIAVTYSYSSTANSPIFYYNGAVQGTTLLGGGPAGSQNSDSGNTLHIGNEYSNAGGGFDGGIDEAFVANVALSSTDISNIINNGMDGSYNVSVQSVLKSAVLNAATNI